MCVYILGQLLLQTLQDLSCMSLFMEAFVRLFLCMGLNYISVVMKHVITKFCLFILSAFHGSPGVVSRVPSSEVLVCSPDAVIKHLPKAAQGRTGLSSLVVPGSVLSLREHHNSRSWGAAPMATTVTWGEQGTHARSCAVHVLLFPCLGRMVASTRKVVPATF